MNLLQEKEREQFYRNDIKGWCWIVQVMENNKIITLCDEFYFYLKIG